MENLKKYFNDLCQQMPLQLTTEATNKIFSYINLLDKWNKAYNLIGDCTQQQMLLRHIFDSFTVIPFITGNNILDVGTGAGLPGIPLAIYFPERQFTLLDSNGKKTRFLQQVAHELSLKNVLVINSRVEAIKPSQLFDIIISRAFASLDKIIALTRHLLSENGRILAMKGKVPTEELAALEEVFKIHVEKLSVPSLNAERHLIILEEKKRGQSHCGS